MARLQRSPQDLDIQNGSVIANKPIPKGTQYGPFIGNLIREPLDRRYAWEVVDPNLRGWLDATLETTNWMKNIRCTSNPDDVNVQHFFKDGHLWYELICDINAGTELLLRPKVPLKVRDMLRENTDDRSDRGSGSQHSEAYEDDFNASNDLDISSHQEQNDNNDQDNDNENEDDEGIDARCIVCDRQCNDIDQLDDHLVASHHYPKDAFRCELCPKSYCYRPSLIRHRALIHGELRKYPCENCTKVGVFTDPSNLQRHIRAHHAGARSHACPECGKTFATSSGLKQHTHIHSSVKPFQCEVCFKAYTQFSNLCRHKRMHADCRMQIKCNKCGQSFSTVTSLSKHKRFCDSTSVNSSLHHQSQHNSQQQQQGVPQLSQAMTTPPNPFLMFRGPSPFFPPGFPPYAGLQGMFPHSPSQAPPFPMLFPKPNVDMSMEHDNKTPPRHMSLQQHQHQHTMKVSPPTAEEASSNLRPSPARPIPMNFNPMMSSTLSNNSHISNNNNKNMKNNHHNSRGSDFHSSEDELPTIRVKDFSIKSLQEDNKFEIKKEISGKRKRSIDSIGDGHENGIDLQVKIKKEPNGIVSSEQPLDLSVTKKKKDSRCSTPIITHTPLSLTPTPTHASEPFIPSPKAITPPHLSVPSPSPSISPRPSPTPSSPGPQMAYPRPIHPLILEAMYRPGMQNFQRPFPFLGPLGHGFDLLKRNNPFPPKPFHEAIMAAGGMAGGKIKDRYSCKFCGKIFPRSANLTRHLRTHTGEQPYKCKYCERSFSISSNLQRHVRNIHNKERPFKCNLCERCFGQQTNLDRHLKKHDADAAGIGIGLGDSPSSNEAEREDTYFDEIRSFMGKVTYSGGAGHLYTPIDVTSVEPDIDDNSDIENDMINIEHTDKEPLNNNETIEVST